MFDSVADFRNNESVNFSTVSKLLADITLNVTFTQEQLKARRIWHKGAVMTWGPMLQDIIINACNIITANDREKLLYRPTLTKDQIDRIGTSFDRLFNHSLWVDPNQEIDKLLMSASKQEDLFNKYFLTINYVLTGNP
ncbi:hypothetical protein AGMMS49546_12220 [Spirochaetia bacterium]|nr:hypothetical protein AGMMS49546_12220 [Spirochaetia bacterium]